MLKSLAIVVLLGLIALTLRWQQGTAAAEAHIAVLAAAVQEPQTLGKFTPATRAVLHSAPQAGEIGQLSSGAPLTVLSREREWVRVRVEGWVRDSELIPADSSLRLSPSAADIRADPDGMKGRVVRWEVEFIALQRADPLRRDMVADEWYILARGPLGENAICYLVVPANLRALAEGLGPLTRIVVTARVRVGRSQPSGVPLLDLESLVRR
jgi:hypothetical protein